MGVLFFFIIVISLFPLGVGVETGPLQKMAGGVVWVAALLASMLAMERLFAGDYADGTLEQILLASPPLPVIVLAKVTAHWLLTGLPMALITPLAGLQYHLPLSAVQGMLASLLLGTPVLSLLGALGAALTLGVRGGGVLIALLILPLSVPVLVYGAGGITASLAGEDAQAYWLLLGALLLLAVLFIPWVIAQALRIALE